MAEIECVKKEVYDEAYQDWCGVHGQLWLTCENAALSRRVEELEIDCARKNLFLSRLFSHKVGKLDRAQDFNEQQELLAALAPQEPEKEGKPAQEKTL